MEAAVDWSTPTVEKVAGCQCEDALKWLIYEVFHQSGYFLYRLIVATRCSQPLK